MCSRRNLRTALALLLCMATEIMMPQSAPKLAPRDMKVYSANKKFYAISAVAAHKTCVFAEGPVGGKPLWTVPGYSQVLFLANDGKHMVEGYPGGNILDPNESPDADFLKFYVEGKQVARLSLKEVLPPDDRPAKTSESPWGDFWGFEGSNRFGILLRPGKKIWFDTDTGKRITP